MVSRPMAWFPSPGLLRAGEEEARMYKGRQTRAGSHSPGAGRPPDSRCEATATMSRKEATRLAWYMCFLSLVLTALGLVLLALSQENLGGLVFEQWTEDALVAIGFSTIGALVAPRFPTRNPIGWLFCAIGLVGAVLLFCGEYAAYSLLSHPGTRPSGEAAAWVASWLWVVHVGLFAFLGLLFPDGRLPTPRWRPFGWLVGATVVAGSVAPAYSPGPVEGPGLHRNPLGIETLPDLSVSVAGLVVAALGGRLRRDHDRPGGVAGRPGRGRHALPPIRRGPHHQPGACLRD